MGNLLDIVSINKASTQTKNELIKEIKETGFYGGMVPRSVTPELTTAGLRDEFGYDNRSI